MSGDLGSVSKFELSVSNGSKTTIEQLAKDLKPLLVVTLKADTALCNKQLKAISELEEDGVFQNKCIPIAVLVGTLNEIEQWEAKMQLKYTIVQGTPEFLELIGCCNRGKVKRSCVLLGTDDKVEFIDVAIKSGNSFVPKLKEYLLTVPQVIPKGKPGKKKSANSATESTTTKIQPPKKVSAKTSKSADASAPTETPAATVAATPVAGATLKLKVTRKSITTKSDSSEKPIAAVKKALTKKKAGKATEATSAEATEAPSAEAISATEPPTTTAGAAKGGRKGGSSPVDKSAEAISTSTPDDESEPAKSQPGKSRPTKNKTTNTKSRRRSDPSSDIESPSGGEVATETQSRQRKRIKITS